MRRPGEQVAGAGRHYRRRYWQPGAPALAIVSGLAALFSWRDVAWRPALAGLSSWQAGITLAFTHHLQWGPQLLFTFGPYGFVEDILPFSRLTAGLGLIYALGVTWGLAAIIVSRLRDSWGLLPAALCAWVALAIAANTVEAPELGAALSLGLALAVMDGKDGEGPQQVLLAGLGAFSAFQLLVEVNVGLVSIFLTVVAVASQGPRLRRAIVTALPFIGCLVLALVAANQSLSNFPSYIRGSLSVLTGYAPAMATGGERGTENWYAVVDLALVAAVFAFALRRRSAAKKAAISLALVGWAWEALKEGFVRHDKHDLVFFAVVLLALCLARLPALAPLQAVAVVVAAVLACLAGGGAPSPMRSPVEDVRAIASEVGDLVLPGKWAGVERYGRLQVRVTGGQLSNGTLALLKGRTFAAEPFEDALSFAYPTLRWRPEPVLQAYSAYTSYLDQLDASFLSGPRAPDVLLWQPETIDGRDPTWDPPATVVAMYCHYSSLGTEGSWLVLAHSRDRCGAPQLLGRVSARFGQLVTSPPAPHAGDIVVASFSVPSPLSAAVEGFLLKPPAVWVLADGHRYRFVTGTASDEHVISAPSSLGFPPGWSGSTISAFSFEGGGWPAGEGKVEVSFYALGLEHA